MVIYVISMYIPSKSETEKKRQLNRLSRGVCPYIKFGRQS